jgi:hypothetical protein
MEESIEINERVSVYSYEFDKTIELDTFDRDDNCNYLTVDEARKLAAVLTAMADKLDPEGAAE